ncbi:MAG: hypothetical protein WBB48_12040 [Thermodesulfobacteriota bacterium]
MSKKTIELEVVQCDYANENGERCSFEADKERMGTCSVCGIDVCGNHSEVSYVTSRVISDSMLRAGQNRYAYCFCVEHVDDLIRLVLETLGDKYEIPPNHLGGGVGETQVLETRTVSVLDKSNSSE